MDTTKLVRATRRLLDELGLGALFALGTGLVAKTGGITYAARTLTAPAAGMTVTDGDGVAGNPTLALANDLAALEGLATTGLAARTGVSTWATRSIVPPAAGIGVTNGDGIAGNPTLALANDLAALEGLATVGNVVRTGDGTMNTYAPACLSLVAAAEAGNARVVTLNLVDVFGTALNRVQRCRAVVLDANGLQTVVGGWTIGVGGGGTAVTGNTQPSVIFDTNATGDATLTVTDVSGAAATTVRLVVQPLSDGATFGTGTGYPAEIGLLFA